MPEEHYKPEYYYWTCDECGYDNTHGKEGMILMSEIENRINQKIIDLQHQLLGHYTKTSELNDADVIRYTAMIEVLKAVTE